MSHTEMNVMITIWSQYIHTLQKIQYGACFYCIFFFQPVYKNMLPLSEAKTKTGKIYISTFNIVMFIKV